MLSFFGDGSTNCGSFHEAMNMASILKAPLVFVCENNGYGEWSPTASQTSVTDIADRAAAYGMPGVVVDGMDLMAVHEAATDAVARARQGLGPTLLECKTYRFYDHVGRDFGILQRDPEEIAYWRERDPIKQWRERLQEMKVLDDAEADAITQRAAAEMDAAIAWAESQADPAPDELFTDVYS